MGLIATGNGGTVSNASDSNIATLKAYSNATISKVFGSQVVVVNQPTSINITVLNPNSFGISNVAWSDVLPTNMSIYISPSTGQPIISTTNCGVGLVTPDFGNRIISFNNGTVDANGFCTVSAYVSPSQPGTYNNTIEARGLTAQDIVGNLVSNSSASNTAVLKVYDGDIGVSKIFTPSSIGRSETSRLSLTLTNNNTYGLTNAAWTDTFPTGLTLAANPNLSSDCGGVVNAVAGSSNLTLTRGTLAAKSSCSVAVDGLSKQ